MTKPNFDAMTRQELRAYLLQHREDQDAVHAMALRIDADPNAITISSDEDLTPHIRRVVEREKAKKLQDQ